MALTELKTVVLAPMPKARVSVAMAEVQWYYARNDEQFGPVSALEFGADGVPANDANGGLFGNAFPYLNSPNSGNK
jgi:hypothetical protein